MRILPHFSGEGIPFWALLHLEQHFRGRVHFYQPPLPLQPSPPLISDCINYEKNVQLTDVVDGVLVSVIVETCGTKAADYTHGACPKFHLRRKRLGSLLLIF